MAFIRKLNFTSKFLELIRTKYHLFWLLNRIMVKNELDRTNYYCLPRFTNEKRCFQIFQGLIA